MPKKVMVFLILLSFIPSVWANPDSYIEIKPFSIKIQDSLTYKSLHVLLYKRLQYEILPRGIKPVLADDSLPSNLVAETFGTIENQDGITVVRFCIKLHDHPSEEIKIIPLDGQPKDDILDLMSLKIRNFLEQTLSGKLRISSTPMDCELLLNGIKVGATPAELLLEKGLYSIKLTHEHLHSFTDTVRIQSGKETSLQISMKFQGDPIKPLLISSSIATICTVISLFVDINLHKQYDALPEYDAFGQKTPDEVFNKYFQRHQASRFILIGSFNISAIGWGATIIRIIRNKSVENKIFGKIN